MILVYNFDFFLMIQFAVPVEVTGMTLYSFPKNMAQVEITYVTFSAYLLYGSLKF